MSLGQIKRAHSQFGLGRRVRLTRNDLGCVVVRSSCVRQNATKLKQLSPTFTSFPLMGKKMLGKLDTEIWLECRVTVSARDHSAEWILLERGAYWCQHLSLEPEALN